MNSIQIKRALISVSDKTGIVDFAKQLQRHDIRIISTGGTLKTLRDAGVSAISVSDVTGFPEILDGRVKTLHPKIHAGLLAIPDDPNHQQQLRELEITPIDMLVVNLYPFEETIANNATSDETVEQIDIGGPAMLRAAAKNYKYKAVISNPGQYSAIILELEKGRTISEQTRFELAKEAFLHTSKYDAVISNYFINPGKRAAAETLPTAFSISLQKAGDLRYGENPHQRAGLYGNFFKFFQKLHGKELSYNNIVDIQAAVELVEEFDESAVVIIKHTNPCGVGSGKTLSDAYQKAFSTDTKSAFGGIIAVNRVLDMETAQAIDRIFTEVVIAPEFENGVLDFMMKRKDRRIIKQIRPLKTEIEFIIKHIAGGILVQTPDDLLANPEQIKVVTKRKPTDKEQTAMTFGWKVAKHVKSNAIVYTLEDRTIGVGAGQMSRLDSSRIAVMKAREAGLDLKNTAVASDAFFPFADGLLAAVQAGATAVIQPGGSVRDAEVIQVAEENNITMIFTGTRHFKH